MNEDDDSDTIKPRHIVIVIIIFVLFAGIVGRMDVDAFSMSEDVPVATQDQVSP